MQVSFILLTIKRCLTIIIQISNARVAGMGEDLELNIGNRYTVALVVFFIPYFIFEVSRAGRSLARKYPG